MAPKGKGTVESKYISYSGKPDAVKAACPVWTGGKAERPYLSVRLSASVRQLLSRLGHKMKLAAIGLNVLLVITALYLFTTKGAPNKDEIFLVVLLFAAPIISVVALSLEGGESWLGLYFKRKALEEKKKIEKLDGSEK